MGYVIFNAAALCLLATLIVFAFCAGVMIPVIARSGASALGRFVGFVRRRATYLATFAAGGALVAMFTMTTTPYYWYSWSSSYAAIEVGDIIIDNPEIMQTGKIPDDVREWYFRKFPSQKLPE